MGSYDTTTNWFGFRTTEWGPDAVENFCNDRTDNLHNICLIGIIGTLLVALAFILKLILI